MIEQQERTFVPLSEVPPQESVIVDRHPEAIPPVESNGAAAEAPGTGEESRRRARAGRKGALRVHELIREGRLYEQERGLKRGRQRLRQLLELGKRYEQEHGLRPEAAKKPFGRLSGAKRDELLATLLECLVHIAKPSFRPELLRLVEGLSKEEAGRLSGS